MAISALDSETEVIEIEKVKMYITSHKDYMVFFNVNFEGVNLSNAR